MATKEEVIATNAAHPDWTARQIAQHLLCGQEYVNKCKELYGLKIAPAAKQSKASIVDLDAAWFAANPGRQTHIREPRMEPAKDKQRAVRYLDEQELAFRSLPAHDTKLRRMILWRVPPDNPMFDPQAPQILKIPFVLLPGEVIEDTDERLVALIHELMVQEAMGDEAAVGRQV